MGKACLCSMQRQGLATFLEETLCALAHSRLACSTAMEQGGACSLSASYPTLPMQDQLQTMSHHG